MGKNIEDKNPSNHKKNRYQRRKKKSHPEKKTMRINSPLPRERTEKKKEKMRTNTEITKNNKYNDY